MKKIAAPILLANKIRRGGCGGCASGCFLLLLLLAALLCGLFILARSPTAAAAERPTRPLHVFLLVDNSNSVFEKGGVGSDPELLRIDAARLFIAYLSIDDPQLAHQVGIIFYGTEAKTAVPLTPLTGETQPDDLLASIAGPPRMGWTDPLAALELAQVQMQETNEPHRPAIVLLTGGEPEWNDAPTAGEKAAYAARLQAKGQALAAAGIPLFTILLAGETTAAGTGITSFWQPLWQELSAATPPGRFFRAPTAAQLPHIYHDIVVTLTKRQTAGIVLQTTVAAAGKEMGLEVAPNLAQLALVVGKRDPSQTVSIVAPDDRPLVERASGVRHAGQAGATREEIWVIEQPPPGTWRVSLHGAGEVTIWQDFMLVAPPTPATPVGAAAPTASPATIAPALPRPTAVAPISLSSAPVASSVPVASPTAPKGAAPDVLPAQPMETIAAPTVPHRRAWFIAGAAVLGLGGAILYRQQRRHRAIVTGTLRLLGQSQTADGHTTIELDALARSALSIGRPPADIPLPGAAARATIQAGAPLAGTHEMLICGDDGLLLDGRPVNHATRLFDTAVLTFGNRVQARYENLRLRRAEREAAR